MSADPSASMARFPSALAVRFRTVSRATFLFKISTEAFKGFFVCYFYNFEYNCEFSALKTTTYQVYLFHPFCKPKMKQF